MMKKKNIWILTLFPEMFEAFSKSGVIGKALKGERSDSLSLNLNFCNIRDHAIGNYKSVDDYPYGGGAGMVLRSDVLEQSLLSIFGDKNKDEFHIVFPCPRGKVWNHKYALEFAEKNINDCSKDLIFICGRYEGIDERFLEKYVDEYISIGDYILSGGELAVMNIIDSSLRFVKGILGNKVSALEESFADDLLEHPQYTKPRDFHGMEVPEVYLSGHHKKIQEHKLLESKKITKKYRPDLYDQYEKRKK